jgi:hypothetical protein
LCGKHAYQSHSSTLRITPTGTDKTAASKNAANAVGRGGGAWTPRHLFSGFAIEALTIP